MVFIMLIESKLEQVVIDVIAQIICKCSVFSGERIKAQNSKKGCIVAFSPIVLIQATQFFISLSLLEIKSDLINIV